MNEHGTITNWHSFVCIGLTRTRPLSNRVPRAQKRNKVQFGILRIFQKTSPKTEQDAGVTTAERRLDQTIATGNGKESVESHHRVYVVGFSHSRHRHRYRLLAHSLRYVVVLVIVVVVVVVFVVFVAIFLLLLLL